MLAKDVEELRVDFVLVHPRARDLHRAQMGLFGDLCRPPHRRELGFALAQTHFVQVHGRIDDGLRRHDAAPAPAAQQVQAVEELSIRFVVLREPVVKALDVAEVVRKPLRELVDWEGDVGSECFHRALDAGPGPVPNLTLSLLGANEEDHAVFGVLIRQHEHAFGLI